MNQAAEDALVEDIYAAALDAARWPPLLERIADSLGAGNGCLTRLSHVDGRGDGLLVRLDPGLREAYDTYYHQKNVFTVVDDFETWKRGWRPNVVFTQDVLPAEDYYRTEYFNDFMRLQDTGEIMHIRLEINGKVSAALGYGRPLRKGAFDQDAYERAQRLQPHLIRAYKLGRALADGFGVSGDLVRALEASPRAVLVVDRDGFVRHANPAAERLLRGATGLTVLGGRLSARHPDTARRLAELVAAATARDGSASGGTLSAPSPDQRLPLAVRISPMKTEQIPLFSRPGLALVCATDLEARVSAPEEELKSIFGLTQAEARLAGAIFDGLSLPEAAERFAVSVNTVRFQLARVFDKTGVQRQAELVKLIMRLSGGAGG